MAKPKDVVITVLVGGQVYVHPDPVHISFGDDGEVTWRCIGGSAVVTFPGDTPFRAKNKQYHVPDGGSVSSGPPEGKHKVRTDPYKYNVEVTIPNALSGKEDIFKKDPEVVVDP